MITKWKISILLSLLLVSFAYGIDPEIHSEHFFLGMPLGSPEANDLIFRDLYILSNNDSTKFADWVAYRLTPEEAFGSLDLERKWRTDPFLDDSETLEVNPDDYRGANAAYSYERGHLAPLADFKGSEQASSVNYYSNIVPQTRAFNNGPWKHLESAVREAVMRGNVVNIIAGTYYDPEFPMPLLPFADESHIVPSGFWKIVCFGTPSDPDISAFLIPHEGFSSNDPTDYVVSINKIEEATGLDFFWQLSEPIEEQFESREHVSEILEL